MITEEEWKDWKLHPVTKAFYALLAAKRQELKDQWEEGVHSEDTPEKYAFKNIAAMHECKAYALVADIEFTDFIPEKEGSESGKR